MSKANDVDAVKVEVAAVIASAIAAKGLSQTAAGKQVGIKQQEISMILRGRVAGYSLQRLLDLARAFGAQVGIKLIKSTSRRAA